MKSSPTPTVIVCRHGSTPLNEPPERFRSWLNVPLDRKGIEQAKVLARSIADEFPKPCLVLTSNLRRAERTGREIANATGARLESCFGLRDWNVGYLKGKRVTPAAIATLMDYMDSPKSVIPGGESFNTFKDRVVACLEASFHFATVESAPLVLVTHTRTIRALIAWHRGGMDQHTFDLQPLKTKEDPIGTGAYLVATKDGDEWTLKRHAISSERGEGV